MKKIEIIFKLNNRRRKSYKWEKYGNGITEYFIGYIIREIYIVYHVENPVILSLREIPYINK